MDLPDPTRLIETAGLELAPIGVYRVIDPALFAPLVEPPPGKRACVFAYFQEWQQGKTLHLTSENYGCGGAGSWLCGVSTRSRDDYVTFLADSEGLKASHALMEAWLDNLVTHLTPLGPQEHLCIGPLRKDPGLYARLQTVTFYVTPDQLSLLATGAQYHAGPNDPPPVIAPFGSGCQQLITAFPDLGVPQAIIGATDIAMRQYLPPDRLAFTETKPMYERLCSLDKRSFLGKPFWRRLREARGTGV